MGKRTFDRPGEGAAIYLVRLIRSFLVYLQRCSSRNCAVFSVVIIMKKIFSVFLILYILIFFLPAGRVFAADTATLSVELDVIGCGDLIPPTDVPADGTGRASDAILRLLAENGYTCFYGGAPEDSFYLAYIADGDKTGSYNGYQSAAPLYPVDAPKKLNIRTNIAPKLKTYLSTHTAFFDETDYETNSAGYLGEFVYTNDSGWMYTLNGDFKQKDLGSVYLKPGDVLRVQFTLCLGLDLGGGADPAAQAAFNAQVGDPATTANAETTAAHAVSTTRAPAHPAISVPTTAAPSTTRQATTAPSTTRQTTTAPPTAPQTTTAPSTTRQAATPPSTTRQTTTTPSTTLQTTTAPTTARQTTTAPPATAATEAVSETTAAPETATAPVSETPATAAVSEEGTAPSAGQNTQPAAQQLTEPASLPIAPAEKKRIYWFIPVAAAVPVTAAAVMIIAKKSKEKKETP